MIRILNGINRKKITSWLLFLVLVAALGACSSAGDGEMEKPLDEPPQVDEAEAARILEEERLAEEQRLEEEKERAEEKRIAEKQQREQDVKDVIGGSGIASISDEDSPQPPRPKGVLPPITDGVPFDEAVPPLPQEPTVKIAVFSEESQQEKGWQVALMIGSSGREFIEAKLGAAVILAYVSHLKKIPTRYSAIHFRPNFFLAAQTVAVELPNRQTVEPMTESELKREGVDLIVYVGKDFK